MPDHLLDPLVWEDVSEEAQREFLKYGEEMVKATLTLAQGADVRATTMMGMFGAVGVALIAASLANLASDKPSWALLTGAVMTGLGLFIACGFCFAAARPTDFSITGFEPHNLLHSSAKNDAYRTRVLIAVTQDRIDRNRAEIERAARHTLRAMIAAGISLGAGIAAFLAAAGATRLF